MLQPGQMSVLSMYLFRFSTVGATLLVLDAVTPLLHAAETMLARCLPAIPFVLARGKNLSLPLEQNEKQEPI